MIDLNALDDVIASQMSGGCRLYKPYPKAKLFHDLGAKFDVRCLSGGNRTGKTLAFYSGELGFHMTGEYPDWWKGRRWKRPVTAWVGSTDWSTNVEGCQLRLVGDVSRGTLGQATIDDETGEWIPCGIPADRIHSVKKHGQVAGALTEVMVKHVSGGLSRCRFIAYSKGRENLQAGKVDIVGMDEEPPLSIATELMARTIDSRGISVLTFTPLKGVSQVVQRFIGEVTIDDEFPEVLESSLGALVRVRARDAPHITPDILAAMHRQYPIHEHPARIEGIPALGAGAIFPYPDEMISCVPFQPPWHWRVLDGVDFGIRHATARARVIMDPDNERFFVTQVYKVSNQTTLVHAGAWKQQFKGNVPLCWPGDGMKRQEDIDAKTLITLKDRYQALGVMMTDGPAILPTGGNSLEGSVTMMAELMQAGRWQVFSTCPQWFAEKAAYRREVKGDEVTGRAEIYKVFDDCIDSSRYAMMGLLCGYGVTIQQAFGRRSTKMTREVALQLGKPLPHDIEDDESYDWTPGS